MWLDVARRTLNTHTLSLYLEDQGQHYPLTMLMLSSSMELIAPYRYKDTPTTSNEEKKKKRSKKRPPPPKVADFLLY